MMYDSIVIGSGPSGASAAYEIARTGAKVLILERFKLPRYKPCGGMIPLNFFRTLPPRTKQTLETTLSGVTCTGPGPKNFTSRLKISVAGVMRDRFDREFALSAVDEGADLIDGLPVLGLEERPDRVVVRTARGSFEAKTLVGADGATGITKRNLGIGSRNPPAAALEAELKPNPAFPRQEILADCGIIKDGYAWIIPKGNADSVGLASFGRDRKNVRKKLAEWARMRGYRLDGERIHGHPIPIWKGHSKLCTRRALLVGDAADTVDSLVGEGIRYGIQSGRLAAKAVQEALQTGRIPAGYAGTLYEEIHSDFVYAKWIAKLFYRCPRFFFDLWVRSSSGVDLMSQVAYGEIRYRELFDKAMRALLRPANYRRLFPPRPQPIL